MDDSCAVCADALDWVAYGPCGHREVCSTCVVRLRFVLGDRQCCICKTENPVVFVTKAMGDYTRVISDFSAFPPGVTEGKAGEYWYHEDTEAYFDDPDQYWMIKAMCRLSCSVCDKDAEENGGMARRRTRYKSIEQLKGHLFHQHKLFMCSLCLEGRKVFICEQKLYNKQQLKQHIHTGDSEVDGSESERGGFMGHPMCEFCKTPFYGDNELYMHMSTEHFTCHICQRRHPGQYDYYRNYDDLEMHFRQEHYLCEDEACLAKKFVVFQSEPEIKRHNVMEHKGHMSRSKRNAVLQIPTSFRYRGNNEEDQRRGRGRGFRRDQSIEIRLETAIADIRNHASSYVARPVVDQGDTSQNNFATVSLETSTNNAEHLRSVVQSQNSMNIPVIEESSFPPLSDWEPQSSARYVQALQITRNTTHLGAELFPPLSGAENSSTLKPTQGSEGSSKNTLAAQLHLRNKGSMTWSSAWSKLSKSHETGSSSSAISRTRTATNPGISSSTSASSQPLSTTNHEVSSSTSVSSQPWPTIGQVASSSSSAVVQVKSTRENRSMPRNSAHSAWSTNSANRMKYSASAHNLTKEGSLNRPSSSMVSGVVGTQGLPTSSQSVLNAEDVHTANKSLVERIRASLGMDEDKFAAFKNISAEYRQCQINTWEYLSYVEQFGLSHLVLELAWSCPDPNKQKELTDAYNANLRGKGRLENGGSDAIISKEGKKVKVKGKGKGVNHTSNSSPKDILANSILDTVRKLQLNQKPQEEEVETLSKDGYRANKDKMQLSSGEAPPDLFESSANIEHPAKSATSNGGRTKQQKKASKFHRVRLGDGSAAAFLENLGRSDPSPEHLDWESSSNATEGIPTRGVWRNGGGMRLVANSLKDFS